MLGLGGIAKKVFGNQNDRRIKAIRPLVDKINELEPEFIALSDQGIIDKTEEFKSRLKEGETLDALLPEAFANAREAAKRALGLRPYDVQLLAGIFLHQGDITEMKTGEGKTLMATLPVYLNALTGRGVHVVTVNDYLASRDAEWMSAVYTALGLSTGVVVPGMTEPDKQTAYACDVTYATNNELGFDYLRDNMKADLSQMVQRDHFFAIVDEVDSILIDEARTPLIISGPSEDRSDLYSAIDKLIPDLTSEHYDLDEKQRSATFTEDGNEYLENQLKALALLDGDATLYDPESSTLVHHLNQALRAHTLFKREKNYDVRNDQVMLIDEFTGRMMEGRRLSEGLHQAIEAKEGLEIQPENVTLASVTFQNYFRLYEKLAGMTGTALTEADEFLEIYNLGVIEIPTNMPIARVDEDDKIYKTAQEKYNAIVEEIKLAVERGQPILVGTTSIEKSELLSAMLKEENIAHNVLNARYHEKEAAIVADAGLPSAVTIATNMAGRGTDIQLGGNVDMRVADIAESQEGDVDIDALREQIKAETEIEKTKAIDAGGLFVLATERHESRRIDNQLRGRSGRQGDPGRSAFYLSLEDDLMRIFGSERLEKVLSTLGMDEGEAITHPWVNKSLERAQAKVEGRNFDMRKQVLKFDDVMNDQRKVIFEQRREIMEDDDLAETVKEMRDQVIDDLVDEHIPAKSYADQWNVEKLYGDVLQYLGVDLPIVDWAKEEGVDDEIIRTRLYDAADKHMAKKVAQYGPENMRHVEKQVVLQTIDAQWREHLLTLDHLRSVIGFRGYAQRDPLNEYKSEAFGLFDDLLTKLRSEITGQLAHVRLVTQEEQAEMNKEMEAFITAQEEQGQAASAGDAPAEFDENDRSSWGNPSRNDACPCRSGKKFKHCHGRLG